MQDTTGFDLARGLFSIFSTFRCYLFSKCKIFLDTCLAPNSRRILKNVKYLLSKHSRFQSQTRRKHKHAFIKWSQNRLHIMPFLLVCPWDVFDLPTNKHCLKIKQVQETKAAVPQRPTWFQTPETWSQNIEITPLHLAAIKDLNIRPPLC